MARMILFWSHLCVALLTGLWLISMALSGCMLSFEPQILSSVQKMSQESVENPAPFWKPNEQPLPSQLLSFAQAWRPGAAVATMRLEKEPWQMEVEWRDGYRLSASAAGLQMTSVSLVAAKNLLNLVEEWHRWLALDGAMREWGKTSVSIANFGLLFLILSGLWLWWPKGGAKKALRWRLMPQAGLQGNVQKRQWHYMVGAWATPLLLVTSLTGVLISNRWAEQGLAWLAGLGASQEAGSRGEQPGGRKARGPAKPGSDAGLTRTSFEALDQVLSKASSRNAAWKRLEIRPSRGKEIELTIRLMEKQQPQWQGSILRMEFGSGKETWESYEQQTRASRWRSWIRPLHTGQAFGWFGQLLVFTGSSACSILIWTGLTLSYQRAKAYKRRRSKDTRFQAFVNSENTCR